MVYIKIREQDGIIILDCHKNSRDGEYFKLTLDKKTKKVIERPEHSDTDVSTTYNHICSLLDKKEPLPKESVSA